MPNGNLNLNYVGIIIKYGKKNLKGRIHFSSDGVLPTAI